MTEKIPYYKECVSFFMEKYHEQTGVKYSFEAKDGKALKSVLKKIDSIKGNHDALLLFRQIIIKLPEWDKQYAFSLTNINNRFNVIIAAITKQKKVSDDFKDKIISDIFK